MAVPRPAARATLVGASSRSSAMMSPRPRSHVRGPRVPRARRLPNTGLPIDEGAGRPRGSPFPFGCLHGADGDGSLIPAAVQRTRVEPSGVKAPRFSYVGGAERRARRAAAAPARRASPRRSARRPSRSSRAVPCAIRLEPNGGVLCSVGVKEQGQGTDTVMAQIAAAALGVAIDDVRVISGETDAVPYGGGTFGSRAVAIGGEAVHRAACDLRQEILVMAGQLLQADPATLDIVDGAVVVCASGAKRLPLAEIGRIGHFQLAELPKGAQPVLSHTRRFHLADDLYILTNGVHGAHVEVDGLCDASQALGGGGLRARDQSAAG